MEQSDIIRCYNTTAKNYAEQYKDEIGKKHLDRLLLKTFAAENINSRILDLGCGPGQTTKYLSDCGAADLIGVDISPSMIEAAKSMYPSIVFEIADMLNLQYTDNSFGAAIAFYSIVHFDDRQVETAFGEIKRVLLNGASFLFSFHIGDHVVHLDEFLGHRVSMDFHFFETEKIIALLRGIGFTIIDIIERAPYPEIEYPSKRAYIWAKVSN